jgi:Tfp pilus assembly protein PilN
MMIEVNLLPAELRRAERTPLPRLLVIVMGTALVMTTASFAVVFNFRKVPDLQSKLMVLQDDIAVSEKQAAEHDKLLEAIEETRDRKKAIAEVWRARIFWSEKLCQLAEMTPSYIGMLSIKLEETRATGRVGEKENGGYLNFETICAGADHSRLADWRRILSGALSVKTAHDPWVGKEFFSAFLDLEPNSTRRKEMPDYVEGEALEFTLKMTLKSASQRMQEAVQAILQRVNQQKTEQAAAAPRATKTASTAAPTGAKTPAPTDAATEKPADAPDTAKESKELKESALESGASTDAEDTDAGATPAEAPKSETKSETKSD